MRVKSYVYIFGGSFSLFGSAVDVKNDGLWIFILPSVFLERGIYMYLCHFSHSILLLLSDRQTVLVVSWIFILPSVFSERGIYMYLCHLSRSMLLLLLD